MPRFARHAGNLHESATMRIIGRAKQMKDAGEDVVSFGAGGVWNNLRSAVARP